MKVSVGRINSNTAQKRIAQNHPIKTPNDNVAMLTPLTAHSTKPTTPQQLHRLEISTAMLILHVSAMHQIPRQRASHANTTGEVREDLKLKLSSANSQNSLCLISKVNHRILIRLSLRKMTPSVVSKLLLEIAMSMPYWRLPASPTCDSL
eukprot:scaffold27829_cov64-Cyclotella_meneghiniana.AAC.4